MAGWLAGWLAGWRWLALAGWQGAARRGVAWRGVAGCHAVLSQYVLCLLLLLTAAGYVRLSQTAVLVAIPCEEIYHAGIFRFLFFLSPPQSHYPPWTGPYRNL